MKHTEEHLETVLFQPEKGQSPYPSVEGVLTHYQTGSRLRRYNVYGVRFVVKFLLGNDTMVLQYNRQHQQEVDARKDFARVEQVWEWASR